MSEADDIMGAVARAHNRMHEIAAINRQQRIEAECRFLDAIVSKLQPLMEAAFGPVARVTVDICDYGNYASLYVTVGKMYTSRSARLLSGDVDIAALGAEIIDELAGMLRDLVCEAGIARDALAHLNASRAPATALDRAFRITHRSGDWMR